MLVVLLSGEWRMTSRVPPFDVYLGAASPTKVLIRLDGIERWDSSLLLFVFSAQQWCADNNAVFVADELPPRMQTLLGQLGVCHASSVPKDRTSGFFSSVGVATADIIEKARQFMTFIGACFMSGLALLRCTRKFRWTDCMDQMQQAGAMALPIVSLISFLVGVTLAYTGATILRQYGGDIWVADLVGMSMVREMGALMTGIVLAGRTGAAYAAHIGNMKANEEIDALSTLAISPIEFLVLPRLVALGIMTPLLVLYSNALGIIGGMAIAWGVLSIPPSAYWVELLTIVTMTDVWVGVIKACSFGMIIGLAGCLRGLQAERSASGVGLAATSAVVTSILFIIVADAIFAVIFETLGM